MEDVNRPQIIVMKFHTIISTIAVTLCAMVATAQAELKVATVNVTELYTLFHKRFDTEVRLKDEEAKIKAEIKVREDKLRALQEEDQKIQKKYDPSLSSAQVKKLTEQHNIKMNEIQAAQQELQTYVQRRSLAFKELFRRDRLFFSMRCSRLSLTSLPRVAMISYWTPALRTPPQASRFSPT